VVNGKRMFVNGKVYYFDRKSGTLDSSKVLPEKQVAWVFCCL